MLTKSSTELVRQQNSSLVLSALRRGGPLAHTDLSVLTGLSSATVSAITADLERVGILERLEQKPPTGRGRPRVLFSQRRDSGYIIVVRISSDTVQYSLADYSGTLMDRFEEARGTSSGAGSAAASDPKAFCAAVVAALDRLAQRSRLERRQVVAVSISSKGLVDRDAARLIWSPIFGTAEIDFAALLAGAGWDATVVLSNETLLVAQALMAAAGRGAETPPALAALSLGHSIGLGIARQGRGGETEASAPNFGHMLHTPDAGLCRCGARGCVEAAAGFYGILRKAFQVPSDTIPAKFVPLAEMDKIAVSARQQNRMAGYAFREAGAALGHGLARLISLYGAMPIHVTGLGLRYFDLMHQSMEEALALSHAVRIGGMPAIHVVQDEPGLVFSGHLELALQVVDASILSARL
ncbi:Sugar kinase of the NBD/HSP70 family, may contain an N-terminal HTH domain [Rhizobium sp. RU20A]|uniref:ROK family transcriptional regulator n=1 Tax=Rhizobium sp. RU20A TaxID=1907412 RepID=UPI000956F951|nr:ROK family protein [Rhizobium sp. RU20A]SIQ29941.1 Sugar kinase of the NBD/HSP70 family, may contain an N-terminal HTH domain [Rhizobium sp. RU20A]